MARQQQRRRRRGTGGAWWTLRLPVSDASQKRSRRSYSSMPFQYNGWGGCRPFITRARNAMLRRFVPSGLTLTLALTLATAADWPQWRGPNRDGISKDTGLLQEWPKDGPKIRWKLTDIGPGYSTPVVV